MPNAPVMTWDRMDPFHVLGVKPPAAVYPGSEQTPVAHSVGPGKLTEDGDRLWSPDNPLFWFAALAAATFGLVAASTQIRVGPFRAGASAGKQ